MIILDNFLLFCVKKKICCGYPLEVPNLGFLTSTQNIWLNGGINEQTFQNDRQIFLSKSYNRYVNRVIVRCFPGMNTTRTKNIIVYLYKHGKQGKRL